jgi:hypothetical protein
MFRGLAESVVVAFLLGGAGVSAKSELIKPPVIVDFGADSCEMNMTQSPISEADVAGFGELHEKLQDYYSKNIQPLEVSERALVLEKALEVFSPELEMSRLFRSELGPSLRHLSSRNYALKTFGKEEMDQKYFLATMLYWIKILASDAKLPRPLVEKTIFAVLSPFSNPHNHRGPTKYDIVMQVARRVLLDLYETFDALVFSDVPFRKKLWDTYYVEYILSPPEPQDTFYGHEPHLNAIFKEIFDEEDPRTKSPEPLRSGHTYTVFALAQKIGLTDLNQAQANLLNKAVGSKKEHCLLVRGQKVYFEALKVDPLDPTQTVWQASVLMSGTLDQQSAAAKEKIPVCPKGLVFAFQNPQSRFLDGFRP